ncbi:MAG TPA: protein kinase [Steroidobacteraceae bacterium]|nr:protein kinase [Steroidobacteraceae bacterium]
MQSVTGCAKRAAGGNRAWGGHVSVDPRDSRGEVWARCSGLVVNGAFRLRRCLGSSDHSAVFLAEHETPERSAVALKLVPALPELAESLLSNWRIAAESAHPHLISLLGTGRCQLGQRPYVYAVMEYADQTLAQLLAKRALTDEEAREMLLPTLSALVFLHNRSLVQGALKPANILAVGDQLKLSSDTIRRANDAFAGRGVVSGYDPPEIRDGGYSTAGDIWGLGVTLFEALTRSPPAQLQARGRGVVLPHDFPPRFRELVARCLSLRPSDRPRATEIEAAFARPAAAAPARVPTVQPAAVAAPSAPASAPPDPVATKLVSRPAESPKPKMSPAVAATTGAPRNTPPPASQRRPFVPLTLGAVAVLALSWIGWRALGTHRTPVRAQTSPDASIQTPAAVAPASGGPPSVVAAVATKAPPTDAAASPAAVHEVIPDVPRSARQTIHGHVKVSVRVIVDKEGTVVATRVDDPGPSRYFERLAREAAGKWTFPPAATDTKRLKLVRFEFTRDGTKGRAVSLE